MRSNSTIVMSRMMRLHMSRTQLRNRGIPSFGENQARVVLRKRPILSLVKTGSTELAQLNPLSLARFFEAASKAALAFAFVELLPTFALFDRVCADAEAHPEKTEIWPSTKVFPLALFWGPEKESSSGVRRFKRFYESGPKDCTVAGLGGLHCSRARRTRNLRMFLLTKLAANRTPSLTGTTSASCRVVREQS